MTWLADRQIENNSIRVTYARGNSGVLVLAMIGITEQVVEGIGGQLQTARTDRDYLIRTADLVLNESPITPTKGDRITDGGNVYEVNQIAGEKCFRPCDVHGRMLRIHTKKVV